MQIDNLNIPSIFHTREYAIKCASKYNLEAEITYCIDVLGMSPDEAMMEWDV